LEQARIVVIYSSLVVGSICFLLFLADVVISLSIKHNSNSLNRKSLSVSGSEHANFTAPASLEDLSKLVDSVGKLTEVLLKARPAIVSLIASIIFYVIATVGSGALGTSTECSDLNEEGEIESVDDEGADKTSNKKDELKPREELPQPK